MRDDIRDFHSTMIATLGHAPDLIEPGRFHRFATSEKRGDSAGWCKLFDDMRGGVFGCYRQGISESWTAFDAARMSSVDRAAHARAVEAATRERAAAQRETWAANDERNARLWHECVPLTLGDPVVLYMRRRGLNTWPLPASLRLHSALPYWNDGVKLGTFAAMVAPITGVDGRLLALHRTYLDDEGRKADVPTVKKLTGAAGPLSGASIRLHSPQRGVIGVCEGIETALAASMASGIPTVAAYSAGALAAYSWPCVQSLVIFADADRAGREAADTLRSRAMAARLRCDVVIPLTEGADWADVWAKRDTVAMEGCAA